MAFDFFKTKQEPTVGSVERHAVEDPELQKKLPVLYEYLACQLYEDGSQRALATVSISIFDGAWRVCLNDRETARSAFFTGSSFQKALAAAEAALADNRVAWRTNTWQTEEKKKKKG